MVRAIWRLYYQEEKEEEKKEGGGKVKVRVIYIHSFLAAILWFIRDEIKNSPIKIHAIAAIWNISEGICTTEMTRSKNETAQLNVSTSTRKSAATWERRRGGERGERGQKLCALMAGGRGVNISLLPQCEHNTKPPITPPNSITCIIISYLQHFTHIC